MVPGTHLVSSLTHFEYKDMSQSLPVVSFCALASTWLDIFDPKLLVQEGTSSSSANGIQCLCNEIQRRSSIDDVCDCSMTMLRTRKLMHRDVSWEVADSRDEAR